MWVHVIPHFEKFLAELELTEDQRAGAFGKANRVAQSLAAKYYPNQTFNPSVFTIGGSLGKNTGISTSDVDLIFYLPRHEFARIDGLSGNKQSKLLQEVKLPLDLKYPRTDVRGDGPVVKVPFESYFFEVLPVFVCDDGDLLTAHTREGGSWRRFNPFKEAQKIQQTDNRTRGKATHLNKMVKAWKANCNVEVKSICLEVAANVFVDQWYHRDQSLYYYDWMIRDFFGFMLSAVGDGGMARPEGNTNWIPFDENWQSKARTAYQEALRACEYEKADDEYNASLEWRKIFGTQFPVNHLMSLCRSMQALS